MSYFQANFGYSPEHTSDCHLASSTRIHSCLLIIIDIDYIYLLFLCDPFIHLATASELKEITFLIEIVEIC